jgi:serine acetyltransferase
LRKAVKNAAFRKKNMLDMATSVAINTAVTIGAGAAIIHQFETTPGSY